MIFNRYFACRGATQSSVSDKKLRSQLPGKLRKPMTLDFTELTPE